MKLPNEGVLLRIFLGESDSHDGRPLYELILQEARALNLAGTTVLRGIAGFGASSRIHTAKFLRLSEDLPIVVEIVDTPEQIEKLLPFLDAHVQEGLVTMETVRILHYRHRRSS